MSNTIFPGDPGTTRDENWVAVAQVNEELVRISTSNYFALVNPTSVAKLKGSHSYATSIASSFFGSGSAGKITNLVAALDVHFDSGQISNGLLQVAVADQVWAVQFEGLVSNGSVDLNATSGLLTDSNGVLSNSIDAKLGGVFTGASGNAFVGGFDLIDQLNPFNFVDGLFTIER